VDSSNCFARYMGGDSIQNALIADVFRSDFTSMKLDDFILAMSGSYRQILPIARSMGCQDALPVLSEK